MAAITFNVQESADASYFTIVNEGVDVATQLTLTVIDPDSVPYNYTITVGALLNSFNGLGLEITAATLGYNATKFADGIYQFTLNDGVEDSTIYEGFNAVILQDGMKSALSYRVYLPKATKDYILEKMLYLNNLSYAASVGATDKFNENLEILQNMR
jgi:hypothetical protein